MDTKAEIYEPAAVKSQSVAVMNDFYMEDVGEADRVAEEVRTALKRQGFQLKRNELDAEIVIVPTLARSADAYAPSPEVDRSFPVLASTTSQAGMMSGGMFDGGGFSSDSVSSQPVPKVGLMLTALTREEWKKSATGGQEPARVWRITAVMSAPRDSSQDTVAILLGALEPKLAEIRAGIAPSATSGTR